MFLLNRLTNKQHFIPVFSKTKPAGTRQPGETVTAGELCVTKNKTNEPDGPRQLLIPQFFLGGGKEKYCLISKLENCW